MKNLSRRLVAASAAIAVLSLAACGSAGEDGEDGESSDEVTIGLAVPLTGPSSATGTDSEEGAKFAIDQLNDEEALGSTELKLLVEDDKGTPESGVAAAQKLLDQGAAVLTGTANSSVAVAIANSIGNQDDVLYIVSAAQTQDPLDQQQFGTVFGLTHTNAMYGKSYHSFIADTLKPEKLAVVYENTDFGLNELSTLKANLKGKSEIVKTVKFEREDTDFSNVIAAVRDSGADAIYLAAAGPSIPAAFYEQVDARKLKVEKLMNAGNMVQQLIDEGGDAVDGLYSADIYNAAMDGAPNKKFVKAFREEFDKDPTPLHVLGYESVLLSVEAMKSADSTSDVKKIAEALKDGTWETPRGEVTFDDSGRAQSTTLILQVEGEEFAIVDSIK